MMTELTDDDLNFIVREVGSVRKAIAYCRRIADVNGPLSYQYADAAERLRTHPQWAKARAEGPKVVGHGCTYCPNQADWLMPASEDQGKTVEWMPCCGTCASGWWDGADWDGSALEAVFVKGKEKG